MTGPYLSGGLRIQILPPKNVGEKFLAVSKKHAQRNVSAHALYVCTTVMPEKAIWRL